MRSVKRRPYRSIALALAAFTLAACAQAAAANPYCDFPPGTALAFPGQTTLTALGLDQLGPAEAHEQVGMIYVSANPMVHDAQLAGEGPSRRYCGVYGEDLEVAGVIGPVPDEWQAPGSPG